MKLEKPYIVKSILFMLTLLIFLPGVLAIKQEAATYSGVIESINKDFKFIVVNGAKVPISGNATIVDEKGNILSIDDLKPKLSVVMEGVRSPDGFFAQKIVIKTPKRKP